MSGELWPTLGVSLVCLGYVVGLVLVARRDARRFDQDRAEADAIRRAFDTPPPSSSTARKGSP